MSSKPGGMFRQKSLERLSSPERLDQLLTVVDRKSWLPLAALGTLILAIATWSVLGHVPVYVEGRGILVRPRGIDELHAPGTGRLEAVYVEIGERVERGQVLARLSRPDLEKRLELQRQKRAQLAALEQSAAILSAGDDAAEAEVATHREQMLGLAETIRHNEQQQLARERADLERQLGDARRLAEGRLRRLNGQRELYEQRLISDGALMDDEEAWLDADNRVAGLEAQLRRVETAELEVEQRFLDRKRQVVDFALELQDYEQQVAEVNREIARLELQLIQEASVVAERAGRVLELTASPGEFLTPGARIGALEVADVSAPLGGVTYFSVRDGKRIEPGGNALHRRIVITPDTVERQRFGGIEAEVARVEPFPVTLDEAERQVGNRALAEELVAGGYRIQVTARLAEGEGPGGFEWTSSRGPELEISTGTTTTARIAVERRKPITFVLPFLRESFGLD